LSSIIILKLDDSPHRRNSTVEFAAGPPRHYRNSAKIPPEWMAQFRQVMQSVKTKFQMNCLLSYSVMRFFHKIGYRQSENDDSRYDAIKYLCLTEIAQPPRKWLFEVDEFRRKISRFFRIGGKNPVSPFAAYVPYSNPSPWRDEIPIFIKTGFANRTYVARLSNPRNEFGPSLNPDSSRSLREGRHEQ